MYGNIDLKKRIQKVHNEHEKYEKLFEDVERNTYFEWKEQYFTRVNESKKPYPPKVLQNNWLWDLGGMQYDPVDRALVVMPLILHEVELGCLSEEMEGELYGTQEDLEEGLLDTLFEEELESMREDLKYCFEKLEKDGKLDK